MWKLQVNCIYEEVICSKKRCFPSWRWKKCIDTNAGERENYKRIDCYNTRRSKRVYARKKKTTPNVYLTHQMMMMMNERTGATKCEAIKQIREWNCTNKTNTHINRITDVNGGEKNALSHTHKCCVIMHTVHPPWLDIYSTFFCVCDESAS